MPAEDPEREHRIVEEIVVDCYSETERALGWYYYLEANLSFPFEATCILQRPNSPLRTDQEVRVTSMAPSDDCMKEMQVQVTHEDTTLTVALGQLRCHTRKPATRQAIADWHYWQFRGYEF